MLFDQQYETHFYKQPASGAIGEPVFFIALDKYVIEDIWEVHGTLGSDGSAVTLQVERLSGTEASGAGDDLLDTPFNLKATIDTIQKGVIAGGIGRKLDPGDRLGVVLTGTPTAVNNTVVGVRLARRLK